MGGSYVMFIHNNADLEQLISDEDDLIIAYLLQGRLGSVNSLSFILLL